MINEINILHERHSCDFACHTCKETAGLLCIVSYHHEIIIELGENSSPIRSRLDIVASHGTTLRSCVLTDLYGLGVNAEYVFGAVNGYSHILAYFFGKPRRQLTAGIELPTAYQVWQIILAYPEDSDEICYEVAHKQSNSS